MHKLSIIKHDSIADSVHNGESSDLTLSFDDQILIGGALTALGSLVEALVTTWDITENGESNRNNKNGGRIDKNRNEILTLTNKVCTEVLDMIILVLNLSDSPINPNPKSSNINEIMRDRYCDLKILALKVLKGLATRRLLQIMVEEESLYSNENKKLIFDILIDIVKSYGQPDSGDSARLGLRLWLWLRLALARRKLFKSNLNSYPNSNPNSNPNSSPTHNLIPNHSGVSKGRASGKSRKIVAAIDALSFICVTGVWTGKG
jgi:hypothetical protein